jgi:carboxymethylenebutenolidase
MCAKRVEQLDLGYLAVPEGGGPGLVVVHDVWGLYDHYRDLARRFASWGFVTLAVDLYQPMGGATVVDFAPFMRELDDPAIVDTLRRAVGFLAAHPDVAGRKVGMTGFCMGGMYTLLAGAKVPGIAAIAPFYGLLSHEHGPLSSEAGLDPAKKPWQPIDAAREVRCPVLAFYGKEDALIPNPDVEELARRLGTLPVSTEVRHYEGAGHAFFNDTREALYRPDAARDAGVRLREFLTRELVGSADPANSPGSSR